MDASRGEFLMTDFDINCFTSLTSLETHDSDYHNNDVRISNFKNLSRLTELRITGSYVVPTDLIEIARMPHLKLLDIYYAEVSVDLAREIAMSSSLHTFAALSDIVDTDVQLFLANGQLTDLTTPNLVGCDEFIEAVMNNKMISNLTCKIPVEFQEKIVNFEGIVNLVIPNAVTFEIKWDFT